MTFKKRCIGCKKPIEEKAKVCESCRSSQNRLLFSLENFGRFSSPLFALLSLVVSAVAFSFSIKPPSPEPKLSAFISSFRKDDFSYLVTNTGDTILEIKSVNLRITLSQRTTLFAASLWYDLDAPILLEAGQSDRIQIKYATFTERDSRWTATANNALHETEEFDEKFLSIAAKMGSNLHCEIATVFTGSGYYKYNNSNQLHTNGNCVPAMQFAAGTLVTIRN